MAVLLVALSELLRLPIWHRGERLSIGWGEAAVLVSCGLVHAPWLVIASCAGQVIAQTIVRKPLIKATFNVADFTAATGVVALLVPWSGNLRELAMPRHLPFLVDRRARLQPHHRRRGGHRRRCFHRRQLARRRCAASTASAC